MKKIISFFTMALVAISASLCVFAADSPSGEVKPDQFNIVGTITKDGSAYSSVNVKLDDADNVTTDSKGSFRIENIKSGDHVIAITKDSKEIGTINFTIAKGNNTKFDKLDDGSYNISVAANISTLAIDFAIDNNGNVTITKVSAAGNDSPQSPGTGDVFSVVCMTLLLISCGGVLTAAYYRKRYSL